MPQRLALVTLIVRNYDEAIAFYTQVLGFNLESDLDMGEGKRWVIVTPPGTEASSGLLLAEAKTEEEKAAVGQQGASRVWLFLHTDDFWRDYPALQGRGLKFLEEPRSESYGHVAVFEDLYGNKWDLLEPLG
ncbi:VOC family protein [Hymenobacter monticola]|uniref:VOC family protein n=1 Tax=Hymenobacter monticola TaxID=1705399 RepID=A0ABY4BC22_9BACT|nr:VOC family protein [Hymenobacter monticola]UOE35323.1 VOC family protein [Hymenobacter monticola]